MNYKLQSTKYKLKKSSGGYTLIEFLIVIGILSLSVGSVLLLLTTTIKSSNQANVVSEVKQNAQNVMDNLQDQIRNGSDVVILGGGQLLGGQSGIFLTTPSGVNLTIICFSTVSLTTNGWIGVAKSTSTVPDPTSGDFSSLTNTDTTSGVDINCTGGTNGTAFSVSTGTSSVKVVEINFLASQGVLAPSRVDFKANEEFRTTVSLRQYK